MTGDDLPDEHSVSRITSAQHYEESDLQPSAFLLAAKDTDGLSVNWLELLSSDRGKALELLLATVHKKRRVRPSNRFATVCVGAAKVRILELCHEQQCSPINVTVRHAPEEPPEFAYSDPSHSLVANFGAEVALLVAEAMVQVSEIGDPVGTPPASAS